MPKRKQTKKKTSGTKVSNPPQATSPRRSPIQAARADSEFYNNPYRQTPWVEGPTRIGLLSVPPILQHPRHQSFNHQNIARALREVGTARALCVLPARFICTRGLTFYKTADPDDETVDDAVQAAWETIQGNALLEKVIVATRAHGWALVVSSPPSSQFSYAMGQEDAWRVLTPDRVHQLLIDADGDILQYEIKPRDLPTTVSAKWLTAPTYLKEILDASEVYHVENEPQDDHLGRSVLQAPWEDLWYLEFQKYYAYKFDADQSEDVILLPVNATIDQGTVDSQIDELLDRANKIEGYREQTRVVTYAVEAYGTAAGSAPPVPSIMASGSRAPQYTVHREDRFRDIAASEFMTASQLSGSKPGVLHGAQEDGLGLQDTLRGIARHYITWVQYFLEREGLIPDGWAGRIVPDLDLRLTPVEEQDAALKGEQINQIKLAYMSINEIRVEQGLPPLGPEYDAIGAPSATPSTLDVESPDDADDDDPFDADFPTPRQDARHIMVTSTRSDSTGSLVYRGPLLTAPDPLQYGQHWEVRPAEEVAKFFVGPHTKEFYLGLDDIYPGSHPTSIDKADAIGVARHVGEDGLDDWEFDIDPERVRALCASRGVSDWVSPALARGETLPISVALRTALERAPPTYNSPQTIKYVQKELDIRSVVLTRKPRNQFTKITHTPKKSPQP